MITASLAGRAAKRLQKYLLIILQYVCTKQASPSLRGQEDIAPLNYLYCEVVIHMVFIHVGFLSVTP